jgi:acetyl esterase/lipase
MPRLSTQRWLARRLMSLPDPVLRLMAGGGTVYRGGRTLDPRFQFLAAQARKAAPLDTMTPEEARRASGHGFAIVGGDPEPGVRTEGLTLDGPGGPIPCRVYRPASQDPATPVLVYAHGGGGVIGDLEISNALCGVLARLARCPVLSVGYRLAPEHRFPAGVEDLAFAFRWARGHAAELGAPPDRVALGGDSAGATLVAVVAQDLKRAGEQQPVLQLLLYPCVDIAGESPSMTTYADAFPLSRRSIDWSMGHYIGPEHDPADPRLSPLRAADVSGLAPAILVTAGFDPLVDQGEAYARRLRAAGVPVAYRCYDGLAHGFAAFTGVVPAADLACREIAGLVGEGLDGRIG